MKLLSGVFLTDERKTLVEMGIAKYADFEFELDIGTSRHKYSSIEVTDEEYMLLWLKHPAIVYNEEYGRTGTYRGQ